MATLTLPPDYFRTEAERYAKNPTNKKAWLRDQIVKAQQSFIQYQAEINGIGQELVKLGAYKSQTSGLIVGGTILSSIPAGFTQVIGGVLVLSASFFAKAENAAKNQRIANLQAVGQARYQEMMLVAEYHRKYVNELRLLNILPIALTGILIFLIIK